MTAAAIPEVSRGSGVRTRERAGGAGDRRQGETRPWVALMARHRTRTVGRPLGREATGLCVGPPAWSLNHGHPPLLLLAQPGLSGQADSNSSMLRLKTASNRAAHASPDHPIAQRLGPVAEAPPECQRP